MSVAINAASSVTNVVSVSGGGETNTANDTWSDVTAIGQAADMTIQVFHAGNFRQGQTGAVYLLEATNSGHGPTTGTVTVTEFLPTGLTATSMSGPGWNCDPVALVCTRADTLAAGSYYPDITLVVNVAANAPSTVTNTATASGGGELNFSNDSYPDVTTITQVADLTVFKTHAGAFTQGQSGAAYTIVASNAGPGPTLGAVTVTDTLPLGLTATAIAGSGWSCTLATLTCTRADVLASGSSYPPITVTVNVSNTARSLLVNAAAVSGGGELNTLNNTASDSTPIIQVADLIISLSHPSNFTQGQTGATYSMIVSNFGPGPTAGAVSVSDILPPGLTATAMAGPGWTCTPATVSCTRVDSLASGAAYPAITLTVAVANNAPASLTNNAQVSGGGELNTSNNAAADLTLVTQLADLTVFKSHAGTLTQGQTGVVYSLQVSNVGAASTTGLVSLSDTLPAGLTATSITGSGWNCTLAPLGCSRADVLPPGSAYPPVSVVVNVGANAPAFVTNQAAVSGGGEVITSNDIALDSAAVIPVADLSIASAHSGAFTQGQTGSFTLTVTNTGLGVTNGAVTVSDTLPGGLSAYALAGNGWTCSLNLLTCSRNDTLAPGASYPPIVLSVNVAANAPASLANMAVVAGGGELNTANDVATDTAGIVQVADLTVSLNHAAAFVQGQTGAAYLLTVNNAGPGPTAGTVTVTANVPSGLTATALSGTGWNCALATLTCTRADALRAGAAYPSVTLSVNVAANAPASLTSTAAVSGGGELNTSNDTALDATVITPVADLTLASSHAASFTQGQTGVNYILTVSNLGPGPTAGPVSVADLVPAGLTATALAGPGWTCTLATATCARADSLAAGAAYPAIVLTVNVAANAPATVINTAVVSGGGELNTANDTATDSAAIIPVADLAITSSHAGTFTQGQTGVSFTLTVSNIGPGNTQGGIAVADSLPGGLQATAIAGPGWTCALASLTCTRADTLAPGSSYPAIILTADVAANAPPSLRNTATVSGGGELNLLNDTASDPVPIVQVADLTVALSHTGNFTQGQMGAQYAITVANAGPGPATGVVMVTDVLPASLVPTSLSGPGWNCLVAMLTCARSDALPPGAAYPPIALSVNVAGNAPAAVTHSVAVSGGGEINTANDAAVDVAIVAQLVAVTLNTNPPGLNYQVDGITYSGPQTLQWVIGSPHTIAAIDLQAGANSSRFRFQNWSDGGALSHAVLAPLLPATFTASFGSQYLVQVLHFPPEGGTVTPATGFYDAGTVLAVTATPASGFTFSGWIGVSGKSAAASNTYTVTQAQTLTANFTASPGTQTILFAPLPDHTFGDPPIQLSATSTSGLPVSYSVVSGPATLNGATLTLTGAGLVVVRATQPGDANTAAALSVDQAFVVKPVPGKFALNLTANPADGGAIAASPANPDGYVAGSAVQVTATANSGYVFSGFTGDLQSAQASQQVTVKGNLNVTANFLPISQSSADVLLFGVNSGPQTLDTGSSSAPVVSVTPVTGGAWLLAAPDSKTPGAIQVSIDPAVASKLPQGSYTSYLVLTSSTAARVITVKLSAGIAQVERVADAAGYTPGNVASDALFSLIGVNLPTDGANFSLVDGAGSIAALASHLRHPQPDQLPHTLGSYLGPGSGKPGHLYRPEPHGPGPHRTGSARPVLGGCQRPGCSRGQRPARASPGQPFQRTFSKLHQGGWLPGHSRGHGQPGRSGVPHAVWNGHSRPVKPERHRGDRGRLTR